MKVIIVVFLVILLTIFVVKCSADIKYGCKGTESYLPGSLKEITYDPMKSYGFPYYFQNLPPSLNLENRYHSCVGELCGGDYQNAECLERCYILSMKNSTTDKADLICFDKKRDLADYLDCLDGVYHNYKNLDRSVGIGMCKCLDGTTSYVDTKLGCVCHPKLYPQSVRYPQDRFGNLKPYAIY